MPVEPSTSKEFLLHSWPLTTTGLDCRVHLYADFFNSKYYSLTSWLRTVDTESQILGDDYKIYTNFHLHGGLAPPTPSLPLYSRVNYPQVLPCPIFRGQLLLLLHIRKFPPFATRGQQKTSHFSNSSVVAAARVEISQLRSFYNWKSY